MVVSLLIFASLMVFWCLYLSVMNLYVAYKAQKINKYVLPFAYMILAIGGIVDFMMNVTLFAVIFWQLPKELLVTQRLKRNIANSTGWRLKLATGICRYVLNPFTGGANHCG